MIPGVTQTEGQPVIFLPLFIVVAISSLKDLFEDYKKHTSDNQENNKVCQKLTA